MSTSTRDHWRVIDAPIRFEVPVLAAGLAMQVTKRATEAVTQTISILEEEDNELNGLQKEAPVRATLLAFDGLEEAIACEIHGDLDMAESSARQRGGVMATPTRDKPRFTLEEIEEQHAYRLALQIEE